MAERKHIGIRAFFLTFLLSMAVLGVISVGIVIFTGVFNQNGSPQSVAGEPEYQPVSADNLTLLLMSCKEDTKAPDRYTLLRFYPEERVIRIVPLPAELESTVNIKTGTLPELYEYGGVQMVCEGVENVFFVQIDRYLKCNEKALAELIDQVGGLEYQVEKTVEYQDDETEETVRLVEGLQLLGGKKVLDYFGSPLVTELSEEAQLEKQAAFLKAGLQQRFSEGILARTDDLFHFMTNSMQTDLTNYDYTTRKEAIRFLARLDGEKIICGQMSGNYKEEKKRQVFTPSTEGKTLVQGWFETLDQ